MATTTTTSSTRRIQPSCFIQPPSEALEHTYAEAKELTAHANVKEMMAKVRTEVEAKIREIASSVDDHFHVSFDSDGKGRIVMVIVAC